MDHAFSMNVTPALFICGFWVCVCVKSYALYGASRLRDAHRLPERRPAFRARAARFPCHQRETPDIPLHEIPRQRAYGAVQRGLSDAEIPSLYRVEFWCNFRETRWRRHHELTCADGLHSVSWCGGRPRPALKSLSPEALPEHAAARKCELHAPVWVSTHRHPVDTRQRYWQRDPNPCQMQCWGILTGTRGAALGRSRGSPPQHRIAWYGTIQGLNF